MIAEHVGFTFIFSDNAEEEVLGDEESKRAEDKDGDGEAEMVRGSQGRFNQMMTLDFSDDDTEEGMLAASRRRG